MFFQTEHLKNKKKISGKKFPPYQTHPKLLQFSSVISVIYVKIDVNEQADELMDTEL